MFKASNVLTNENDIQHPRTTNYWLTAHGLAGEFARLFMFFPCNKLVTGFLIKNTHNADRGTKSFSIYTSASQDGPYGPYGPNAPQTVVLTGTLQDARRVDPVPVEVFPLTKAIETRFLAFEVNSFYGYGGGLQYLAVY